MAEQWMQMLQDIPPGTDVFDFIQGVLTDQMFPDFGKVYWGFTFLAAALLSLTFIAIVLAFYLKIRNKGYAWMIVQDGACTHISPKAWVPFFWGIMCLLLLAQIAWTHSTFSTKVYTGSFTSFSIVAGAIPIISFAGLSLHVLTNAPLLRKLLIRFSAGGKDAPATGRYDRSVILINVSLFVWCVFAGAILCIPGKKAYRQGDMAGKMYEAVIKNLQKAKVTQDIGALAELTPLMSQVATMDAARRDSNSSGGCIFSSFFIFYLFGAILPAVLLNVYIRNRIKDYDIGVSAAQAPLGTASSWSQSQHNTNVPIPAPAEYFEHLKDDAGAIAVHLPQKLPKDRPFANIIEVRHTTAAPQHLQRIIDMKGANPADKSARLRKALRRDNQMLLAYCLLLIAMGSLAFYMLTGAANRIGAGLQLQISIMWEMYSFVLPASFMSAVFLYDALRNERLDNEISETSVGRPFPRHKASASLPNVITLSQDVSVQEEYAMDEKRGTEKKVNVYRPYR